MITQTRRQRLLVVNGGIVVGLLLLAWLLAGGLSPTTFAQTEESEPTGNLVLVPDVLYVGETTMSIGFHLEYPEKAITIGYSEHFAPEAEDCDSAEAGTSAFTETPARLSLVACTAGKARVQLIEADTETIIAEATAVITLPEAASRGERQACIDPNTLGPCSPEAPSGLDALVLGQRDIAVTWNRLDGAKEYRLDAGSLGTFTLQGTGKSFVVPAGSTHSFSVQAYGNGSTLAAEWGSWSETVTVTTERPPTVTMSASESFRTEGQRVNFTLTGRPAPIYTTLNISISISDTGNRLTSSSTSIMRLRRNTTSSSLSLSTNIDDVCRPNARVTVTIQPSTGYYTYNRGNPSSDSVTITDDDCDPVPECDSAPSLVRNLEVSPGNNRLVVDWDPPLVDGDCDISYQVQRKLATSSSWGNTRRVTATCDTLTGVINGNEYDVQVRACNDAGCGGWSEESGTPQSPPEQVLKPTLTPGNGTLDVSWSAPARGTSPTNYEGQYKESTVHVWTGASSFTSTSPRDTIDGLTDGVSYNVRVRACAGINTCAGAKNCGPWSPMAAETLKPALTAPSNLTVTPMSLRRARLSWTPAEYTDSTIVEQYKVEVREGPRGTWLPLDNMFDTPEVLLGLDQLITGKGLARVKSFHYRVKATDTNTDTNTAYEDSDYSDFIAIVDNPILTSGSANGKNSKGRDDDEYRISMEWDDVADATVYSLRIRELEGDHSSTYWPARTNWPNPDELYGAPVSPIRASGGHVRVSPSGFRKNKLYGIQVVYYVTANVDDGGPDGPVEKTWQVFSARDAYAWPSSDFPGNGERVATYPFFGHHEDREFEYIICGLTFSRSVVHNPDGSFDPDSRGRSWIRLLAAAFEEWEVATDDFITVTRDKNGHCANNGSNMAQFIMDDDRQNEVRMFDLGSADKPIYSFPEFKSDVFKICVDEAAACVTSFTGYSGYTPQIPLLRERIGELIRKKREGELDLQDPLDRIELLELAVILGIAFSKERKASNVLQGVDISFSKGSFDGDDLRIPTSTQFNTCSPDTYTNDDDPDAGYSAFRIALHEAGHAIGLSNFDYIDLVFTGDQPYEAAHPTIPDSTMNYDGDDHGTRYIRHPAVKTGFEEPDCSPHPFDVMAIYALYQTMQ